MSRLKGSGRVGGAPEEVGVEHSKGRAAGQPGAQQGDREVHRVHQVFHEGVHLPYRLCVEKCFGYRVCVRRCVELRFLGSGVLGSFAYWV